MNIGRTILTMSLASAVFVSFAAAAAAVRNPDNDSSSYFDSKLSTVTPVARAATAGVPADGSISKDGLYVWKNPDKGWIARSHSYVFSAGGVDHAPDCIAYNLPRPAGGPSPRVGAGS